jgi:hypothetical protein
MTSLSNESVIFTQPNPFAYGSSISIINAPTGIFTNLTATNMTIGTLSVGTITIAGPINQTGTTATIINDPNLSAQTVGAVSVTGYTRAMVNNTVNTVSFVIAGITAAGESLSIKGSCRAKNIGGVGSVSGIFDYYFNSDPALAGASASFAIAGTNITVVVSGVAAQTIRFSGEVNIVQTLFS